MNKIDKLQTVILLVAVGIGFLLGKVELIGQYASHFIVPFLFVMLYGLFLTIPVEALRKAFSNRKFFQASTLINFVWTPLLAWGLGALFLADYPALWIGFIMLMVTPCTDWYLAFTNIAKGNVPLATSILPINLIVQVILLPIYLLLFAGTIEPIPMKILIESILIVLVLPFILAHSTRLLLKNKEVILQDKIIPFFGYGQIFFLSLAILAMFASQGAYLLENGKVISILILPILLFFIVNYLLGHLVGGILKFPYENIVSLNMTIIARNSPIALAIAVTAFPDQPFIALALVIGPLVELPVLAIVSQLMLISKRTIKKGSESV